MDEPGPTRARERVHTCLPEEALARDPDKLRRPEAEAPGAREPARAEEVVVPSDAPLDEGLVRSLSWLIGMTRCSWPGPPIRTIEG